MLPLAIDHVNIQNCRLETIEFLLSLGQNFKGYGNSVIYHT
jgi:hypothetical protein